MGLSTKLPTAKITGPKNKLRIVLNVLAFLNLKIRRLASLGQRRLRQNFHYRIGVSGKNHYGNYDKHKKDCEKNQGSFRHIA